MDPIGSVPEKLADAPASFQKEEQVRLIYMQALISNCTILVISALYYFLLRSSLNADLLLIWTILLYIFSFYRLFLWNSHKNDNKRARPETWLKLYLLGCVMVGLSWSLIYPFLLLSDEQTVVAALLILAFGVMSSALPILSVYIPAFIVYTYPQAISLMATLLYTQDITYSWIALAVAIYLGMLTLFCRNSNKSIFRSINLQYQNRALIEDLNTEIAQREDLIAQRTTELRRKNDDLTAEMAVRKSAEAELRSSETKYRDLIDSSPDIHYRTDLDGRITFISPSVTNFSGFRVEELIGERMEQFYLHPEQREQTLEKLRQQGFITDHEVQLKRKDGAIWWASTNAHLFKDREGNILGVEGVTRDVTARKKVEATLQETKERLAAFMNSATDGFILFDSEFNYLEINNAALELTGLIKEEVLTRKLSDVIPDIGTTDRYREYKKVIDTGIPYQISGLTNHPLTGDKYIELKAFKVSEGLGIIITDITERKRSEDERLRLKAQLHQSQKLESIGTLAGGVAHEFNNMLAIIMGNNQLIMDQSDEGSFIKECSQEVRIAGFRARDVVKQLLTFSRQNDVSKKVLNLRLVLEESLKLIRSSTPINIAINQTLPEDTYPVLANDTQINQLLINLCNNAVDALPQSNGVITIALSKDYVDTHQPELLGKLKAGDYAKLTVSDNGTGMSSETLDRIFDPFYTTKKTGEGTGIGLAIVHGIVKEHGGNIVVSSIPDSGTTYTVILPIHTEVPEVAQPESPIPTGERERILYVDDDPSIAKLGKSLLESLGYTVEATTQAVKALELIKNTPEKFDLLITDMAMPDITGDLLIAESLKIRPDLPTIICTGYSAKLSKEDATELGARAYIMKPIDKNALANLVREVLDETVEAELIN